MVNLGFIVQTLDNNIQYKSMSYEEVEDINGIIFLKSQPSLPKSFLYIGEPETVYRYLTAGDLKHPITVFIPKQDHIDFRPVIGNNNVIQTKMDLIDLYNHLNIIVHNYRFWTVSLMQSLCNGDNLKQIVCKAADMIKSPIFILNPGYKVLYSSTKNYFSDPYADEMLQHGYLSFESIHAFQEGCESKLQVKRYEKLYSKTLGHSYNTYKIFYKENYIALIFIVTTDLQKDIDIHHLIQHFSTLVKKLLLDTYEGIFAQDALCAVFVSDLIENKLVELPEIENRVKQLPYPLKQFVACIVMRFSKEVEKENIPYGYIINQLEDIFPSTNITSYDGDIIILHSQKERALEKLDFDYEKLAELLTRYNAYVGIGNTTRHLQKIRTLYLISSGIIRIGIPMKRSKLSNRIFAYEDYSMYYLIDLAVQKFIQEHHHNDIIYLVHPSVILLSRYDSRHKSNLRDVLFYYLINNCSISQTAQTLYMHRNTVLNKLNKISEIIHIPLDDIYLQHRIIISCLIVRYYERYMNETLKL